MNGLYLEIITPERVMVNEDVEMVEAPGSSGEFGILPGHVAFLTTLQPGEVRFFSDGKPRLVATSGGYAEVSEDKVTLLLDAAEFAEDIDVPRAQRAKERAEATLKDLSMDDEAYRLSEAALLRALARLSTASKSLG
jgi:F-type H+-transporting ATPase subunit epsilon